MNNSDHINPALCEVACFTAAASFSTVPYFSLDQPRDVTLVYNGDQAAPRPFIFADVTKNTDGTNIPVQYYMMSATVNGATVTFLNGQSQLYFAGSGGVGPFRLVGQIDGRSYSTSVYSLVVTVTATYFDGQSVTVNQGSQLMIVNEGNSPIAKGWTVAGVQRLYFSTIANTYMITNGDGSATKFVGLGTIATDFTTLTFNSGTAQYTRTYPNSSRALFNVYGTQISFITPTGLTTSYGYDLNGRLQDIRDPYRKQPGGSVTSIGLYYGANGLGGTVEPGPDGTQWMGRTTGIVVDGNRCLVSAEDPDHVLTTFTCDANGLLSTITDRKGAVTTLVYDPFTWKLSQTILPSVPIDAGGGSTTIANPVINYSPWQAKGLPTSVTSPSVLWNDPVTSSVVGTITDPAGRTTTFTPNRYGQGTDVTNPLGMHTMTTYLGFLPKRITHPNGAVDTLGYDSYGRLIRSHPAGQYLTTYSYTASGLPAIKSGAGSRFEALTYNANSQLTRRSFGGNPAQTLDLWYDPVTSRVDSTKDNAGHTTQYSYDPKFGNLSQTILPGSRLIQKEFDAFGRDSVIHPLSTIPRTILYDTMNRATTTYDRVWRTTGWVTERVMSVAYDALFATDFYDANGNHYQSTHNALGWPTQECDPLNLCSTTRYDASGAISSTTNRRGQMVSLTRDIGGRLTSRTGPGLDANNYSYSSNGAITVGWNSIERDSIFQNPGTFSVAASDSVVTWLEGTKRFRIYNRPPRPVADTEMTTLSSNTGVTFYDRQALYSSGGFLSTLKLNMPGGGANVATATFTPDLDGAGGTNTIPGGGSRTSHALATHWTADVNFSNVNLISAFRRQYHYDGGGRIDQMMAGNATNFTYDEQGRLQSRYITTGCTWGGPWPADTIWGPLASCNSVVSSEVFTYDAMGNRTDHGGAPAAGNRYVVLNGGYYYYDADGNVIQKYNDQIYNFEYSWNAENQLDSTVYNGWSRTYYDYNAFGKPVRTWEGDPNGRHVSRYLLWNGDALVAEFDPNGQRQVDYTYLPGTIDHPFAHTWGATTPSLTRYHEVDELGNVVGTSESGNLRQTNTYDAWGKVTVGGNLDQHLFWKGLFWNSDITGLYFVRNRWYDPEGGRFTNEDPAGFRGGTNLYAFAGNDPINGADPYGLWCVKIPLGFASLKVGSDCNGSHSPGPLKKGAIKPNPVPACLVDREVQLTIGAAALAHAPFFAAVGVGVDVGITLPQGRVFVIGSGSSNFGPGVGIFAGWTGGLGVATDIQEGWTTATATVVQGNYGWGPVAEGIAVARDNENGDWNLTKGLLGVGGGAQVSVGEVGMIRGYSPPLFNGVRRLIGSCQ